MRDDFCWWLFFPFINSASYFSKKGGYAHVGSMMSDFKADFVIESFLFCIVVDITEKSSHMMREWWRDGMVFSSVECLTIISYRMGGKAWFTGFASVS